MSNQYLAQHTERKNTLLALLADAQEYFAAHDKTRDADALQKHRRSIEEGLFSIVLIGEFSAGKSTFLNALMQKRILPSYTRETTAAVNFLRHTSKAPNGEAGIVYYRDGSTQVVPDLSVDTLTKYVTVAGDSEGKTVAETTEKVDLFLESQFLEDGVMLVDSPGLNGITENLEEITRQQIKESHASIFMFSADRPGSKTDFETLRDLRAQCSRIFIVLNKIDAIKSNEGETVETVVAQLKENYGAQFPDSKTLPEIYPISAYQALLARDPDYQDPKQQKKDAEYCSRMEESSRMQDFEKRLYQYLVEGEKTREAFRAPVHIVQDMLKREVAELDEQIKVLHAERDPQDLIDQKQQVEDELAELREKKATREQEVRKKLRPAMRDVLDRASFDLGKIAEAVRAEAEGFEEIEDLRSFAEALQSELEKKYRKQMERMERELRKKIEDVADEVSGQEVSELEKKISSIPGGVLNVSPCEFQMTEMEIGKFIEADEEDFVKKKREMDDLEKKLREMEFEKMKAFEIEQEINGKKQELENIAQRRDDFEAYFPIPDVKRTRRPVRRTEKRESDGLLGKAMVFLLGDKREYIDMEECEDRREHEAAIKRRDKRLEEFDKRNNEIRSEMSQYRAPEKSSRRLEAELKCQRENLQEMHRDYKESLKRHTEKIAADVAKAMKRIRREIVKYVDEYGYEFQKAVESGLDEMQKQSCKAVCELVSMRLGEEVQRCEKRLNKLIADSQASDAERNTKLQQAEEARLTVEDLMKRSAELEAEIESEMNDKIKEA